MIEIYTDGASSGNPGISAAGIIIKTNKEVYEYSYLLGLLSNHEAEFHAIIKALELCKEKYPNEILSFRSDSKVVVDVINKGHTKNESFLPLLKKIEELTLNFPYFFIKWIPEKLNTHADRLARRTVYEAKNNK